MKTANKFKRYAPKKGPLQHQVEKLKKLLPFSAAVACIALSACFRGSGHWQVVLHDVDVHMAFTIQRVQNGKESLTVIFEDKYTGALKPTYYSLPKDAVSLPDTKLIFADTTMLPGRVTLQVLGHTLDIMERALIINGKDHSWNETEPIKIKRNLTMPSSETRDR